MTSLPAAVSPNHRRGEMFENKGDNRKPMKRRPITAVALPNTYEIIIKQFLTKQTPLPIVLPLLDQWYRDSPF